ncbi:hypothetical protein O1611_g287 [Lasiodiplodia mahajangana]|uniref:Uncharacterized protein n=1 Tax=Lasiodiplodia mahajangana TaxID=1108764 RepID=A0ACC2K1D3_9PEZI|nr:hypothetical protein O1611_g287 [Lasiodiplodia mahajangana]
MDGAASLSSWETTPIEKSASAPWHGDISSSELAKLLHGFIPEAMEEKWFIYADAADAQGKMAIHFCRSWTGAEIVRLHISVSLNAVGTVDMNAPAKVTGITWEDDYRAEEGAKLLVEELCSGLLSCNFANQSRECHHRPRRIKCSAMLLGWGCGGFI